MTAVDPTPDDDLTRLAARMVHAERITELFSFRVRPVEAQLVRDAVERAAVTFTTFVRDALAHEIQRLEAEDA